MRRSKVGYCHCTEFRFEIFLYVQLDEFSRREIIKVLTEAEGHGKYGYRFYVLPNPTSGIVVTYYTNGDTTMQDQCSELCTKRMIIISQRTP